MREIYIYIIQGDFLFIYLFLIIIKTTPGKQGFMASEEDSSS